MPNVKTLTFEPAKTLAEIAAEMGVSKQYIQQVENSALKKLRTYCEKRNIELRDFALSENDRIEMDNGAYIPESGEKLPHTLPPRIHGFEPVVIPPFPLAKE